MESFVFRINTEDSYDGMKILVNIPYVNLSVSF